MSAVGRSNPVFRAVADPTRRAILERLCVAELPVNDIAGTFRVSRPAISRHLRILRRSGLVRERREGRRRIYTLNAEPLVHVDQWLERYRAMWTTHLMRLKQFAEARARDKR